MAGQNADRQNSPDNKRGATSKLVAAPSVSLPKGGGALKGIGEKFSSNPVTGTGSMSIPIYLSHGRSDFTPQLSLSYDSGSGNGIFGMGWQLSLPSITRKTDKGLPQYLDKEESDVFILSDAEDLVPALKRDDDDKEKFIPDVSTIGKGTEAYEVKRYRPRVEGLFAKIERWTNTATRASYWRVISKDNVTSIYGSDDSSRISDPIRSSRVFKWLLSMTLDNKGNVICYEYKKEDGVNAPTKVFQKNRDVSANRYIKRIRYGNRTSFCPTTAPFITTPPPSDDFMFEAVFDYGEHDAATPLPTEAPATTWPCRPDPFSSYRSGFEIRTYRLCRRILMYHHIPGEYDGLVRATKIFYNNDGTDAYSFITSIVQAGYKKISSDPNPNPNNVYEEKCLPSIDFEYSKPEIGNSVRYVDPSELGGIRFSRTGTPGEWTDLYGEGLTGILVREQNGWYYKRNISPYKAATKGINTPGFERARPVPLVPSLASGKQLQIMDLAGDGRPDLVSLGPPVSGFYEVTVDEKIEKFKTLRNVPNIDWSDPNLRFIDLTGDGHADILITEGSVFTWYPSEQERGFGKANRTRIPANEDDGPRVIFADYTQSIFLADMTGDGLTDIVRIRNGNVCYWPNLGYGKFGAKVTMSNVSMFDYVDQFDPKRILLADIDGTGTVDIIYFNAKGCYAYFNNSGNSLSAKYEISNFPLIDSVSYFSTLDLFGDGTACLVWGSPLPSASSSLRYIRLMKNGKPHLLTKVVNNLGAETKIKYAPSTKFYLLDKYNGKPWVTKLPFPVHVVEEVETIDRIGDTRLVTQYTYHHGYFDGREREFRGFGRVDQIDTEHFTEHLENDLDQPPVLTRTWYHTGADIKHKGILDHYISEYNNVYKDEPKLEQPELDKTLTADERREAMRAFKGMSLRQEVYALDKSELENVPYATTQFSYNVKQLQAKNENRHASFLVTQSECLTHHYERDAADPRKAHSLILDMDKYGRPTLAAEVVYARVGATVPGRPPTPQHVNAEQIKNHVVVTETRYADDVKDVDTFRMGVECCVKTWEFTHPNLAVLCCRDWLKENFVNADAIPFEAETSITAAQKRLVEHVETLFYDDGLTDEQPLPIGTMSSHGLPYESYTLSYTQNLLTHLYGVDRVDDGMLVEGGFTQREDNNWWARSGRNVYDNNAAANFYLPSGVQNAFGAETKIVYDNYNLLITSVTDPLDNMIIAINDYRTLSPAQLTDPNGNRTAVETDALGIVIKSAVMGKANANEGDDIENPTAYMMYGFAEFDDSGELTKPSWVKTFSRETHGDTATRWLERVEYSDGLGRIVLEKAQAAPDKDNNPRWVGTGRTVLNNKGNPVKQYEPYFSNNDEWESEAAIRETGVTPIMHYDPLSRLIRTDFPDGTHSKVEFTAWLQKDYDQCDTAESSPHYNTPSITHLDSLGRAFYVVTNDGNGNNPVTRTVLDIEGNEKKIFDARGNIVMEYKHGIHGEKAYTKSMDAGERWTLLAVDGQPLYTWDSRGHRLHATFDELRRPTKQKLSTDGDTEKVVGRTVYGETAADPDVDNLRGQAWKTYDQSGVVENIRYDFKGNLLESKRQLTQEYKQTIDWNANPALEDETFTTVTMYDALNRTTDIRTPHNANIPASKVMPSYDDGGLLKAVNVNLRGATEATPFVTAINYNPKGQRTRIKYGNGATTKYTYDDKTFRLKRLWTFRNDGTENLQDLNYIYDPMGNITAITDNAQQTTFFNGQVVSVNQTFEYDALYRLTKATGREHVNNGADSGIETDGYPNISTPMPGDAAALRNYTRQWEYDNVGNILQLIHSANGGNWNRQYNYADTNNRLLLTVVGQTTVNYTHNEHGSMSSMPHLQNMEWDFAERLSHITKGTTEAYYNYDGSGERVRKIVEKGGVTETRLYLGGFEIFRKKVNDNLELERETLHVMDDVKRIALVETLTMDNGIAVNNFIPVIRYQMSNNIESATLELDDNANIISYEEYYPYGDTSYQAGRDATEVSQKRYRYTGKEKDNESGLYYHSTRYYASWLSRWTAADPAGLVDGVNLYMYCRGNPVIFRDDTGEFTNDPENNICGPFCDGFEPAEVTDIPVHNVYILFYVNDIIGRESFRAATETRASNIRSMSNFNPSRDEIHIHEIEDISDVGTYAIELIDSFLTSGTYAEIAEIGVWSHAGKIDGPRGSINTSEHYFFSSGANRQMSIENWGSFDFNWRQNATMIFYGCNTGNDDVGIAGSFAKRISELDNMQGVTVWGQPSYSYPSFYPDRRSTGILRGIFDRFDDNRPTYYVAGNRNEGLRAMSSQHIPIAIPMNVYRAGEKIGSRFQR